MIVAGAEGFQHKHYRNDNIRAAELAPGDDYGMMREVLSRRFKRLMNEAPRPMPGTPPTPAQVLAMAPADAGAPIDIGDGDDDSPWPDLVVIDGGRGQLTAAQETLAALGIIDVPLVAVAKGPDRDAGMETFFLPGREPFKLKPRDPVLYFVASGAAAISARRACRRSPASARPANARCSTISARSRRSSARRWPISPRCPGSAPRPRARSTTSSTSARGSAFRVGIDSGGIGMQVANARHIYV